VRRASESPSVCGLRISSDEHDTKYGARSVLGQPPAQERSDKPGASSCRINREKEQGESVSGAERNGGERQRAGVQRRRSVKILGRELTEAKPLIGLENLLMLHNPV
jgi:hypothetical protein